MALLLHALYRVVLLALVGLLALLPLEVAHHEYRWGCLPCCRKVAEARRNEAAPLAVPLAEVPGDVDEAD